MEVSVDARTSIVLFLPACETLPECHAKSPAKIHVKMYILFAGLLVPFHLLIVEVFKRPLNNVWAHAKVRRFNL